MRVPSWWTKLTKVEDPFIPWWEAYYGIAISATMVLVTILLLIVLLIDHIA
jgi:hypothetical protein